MWLRSRGQARQMRHLLFRSAALLFSSFRRNPHVIMIGVNGESSFEQSLLRRAPGCEVWGYDYSVDNVRVSCPFFNQEPLLTCPFHQWGPEIKDDPELRDRAHFQPWALGGADDHGEHSNPKYWTLDSLMRHNGTLRSISSQLRHSLSASISGHRFIDILKIDTEGAEFDALTAFVNEHAHSNLPIGQLQLEIHAQGDRGRSEYFFKWWESLEAAGLRPFSFEPNLLHITGRECAKPEVVEVRCFNWVLCRVWPCQPGYPFCQYSFINIRGNHALVNDAFN